MKRVFIIAEAGVNHNGQIDLAKKLIDAAKSAGADAVKFQTFRAEKVISRLAPKAEYQKTTTDSRESQLDMVKKLELSEDAHRTLLDYANQKEIVFFSTPFDLESVDLLVRLGLKTFKIPSGEITNLPYLRKIGALRKNILLSTGMSSLDEIKQALDVLIKTGTKKEQITVLHCNTQYPTPFKDANLLAIKTIQQNLNVAVGYSDHTLGIEAAVAAVALGAVIIEKHLTLDTNMEGPDHKASLEPKMFGAMVTAIRNIEEALGHGQKEVTTSEIPNKAVARKSIVAARKIKKGDMFSEENITVKRPGTGINPMHWDKVIGRMAKKNFQEDELIEL